MSRQLKRLTKDVTSAKKVDKNTLKFNSGVIKPRKIRVCRSKFGHNSEILNTLFFKAYFDL